MITPETLRKKALGLYRTRFLPASARGETIFPLTIPGDRGSTSDAFAKRYDELDRLMAREKTVTGQGYRVEFKQVNTRRHGLQSVPSRIVFDTRDDFLGFIGKQKEYSLFLENRARVLARLPALEPWLSANPGALIDHARDWESLVRVCEYCIAHPVQGRYIRELPLEVHTKFIETHTGILKSLLDVLMPAGSVNPEQTRFEARYGLRQKPSLVRFRILDPAVIPDLARLHLEDITLPVQDLQGLAVALDTLYIVENEINFLSFPRLAGALVIWGRGFAVEQLRPLAWLRDRPIVYWGDIDTAGFRILSLLRSFHPDTRSVMMDAMTYDTYRDLAVPDPGAGAGEPAHLTPGESALYRRLSLHPEAGRLEQEKIHHTYALARLGS